MKTYAAAVSAVSVFLGRVCGMFYLTAIALSLYEVCMRYVFDAPTVWTSETIMALVATAWLLSVGAVTEQRRHITVTTMELVLGARVWRRLTRVAIVLSMVGVAGLIVMLWGPMLKVWQSMQTTGSAFDPPTPTYIKTLFPIAALLYLAQLLANLFRSEADESND